MKKTYVVVSLLSFAFLLIGVPNELDWQYDEGHYVGAARDYLDGRLSTNPEHPPLDKYFIAMSMKALGDNPFGWRFPSLLAGALVALSAFALVLRMTGNLRTAYMAWLLVMANQFWFVMSRMAMLSIFELAFEAAAVWAFVAAMQCKSSRLYMLSGMLFGLSVGSRWMGVVGLAVCCIYCLPRIKNALVIGLMSIATYAITWIPLMVREHRHVSYLVDAQVFIVHWHRIASDPRPCEKWWTWLTSLEIPTGRMELLTNPVIALFGLVAVVYLLCKKQLLLPMLFIMHVAIWTVGIRQVIYHYYYLEAFTWMTIALAVAMQGIKCRQVRLDAVVTSCAVTVIAYPIVIRLFV